MTQTETKPTTENDIPKSESELVEEVINEVADSTENVQSESETKTSSENPAEEETILKARDKQVEVMANKILERETIQLTPEEQQKYEELANSDAEAYRKQMNKLVAEKKKERREQLVKELSEEFEKDTAKENLKVYKQYISDNKTELEGIDFSLSNLRTQLPAGLVSQFQDGEISITEFLDKGKKFMVAYIKGVDSNTPQSGGNKTKSFQVDLNTVSGSASPAIDAKSGQSLVDDYNSGKQLL